MEVQKQKIAKVFERITKHKQVHESVLMVDNSKGDFSYDFDYGDKRKDSPILMASVTKLFITACIFILEEYGELSLEDKITKYFKDDTVNDLHIYKGKDYSTDLKIAHLLSHTSGLPDMVEEGNHKAKKRVIHEDKQINFNEAITISKQLKPHFEPNKRKRAHYTNLNFDILGRIIETITDLKLEDVFKQLIFDPLSLKHTYLPIDEDFIPQAYYQGSLFYFPNTVKSLRASGGCISTAQELMIFTKAFFEGELFNKTFFQEQKINNKLQSSTGPIYYGAGYMKIPLGGLVTLLMGEGELLGHSGSTGSFAFYHPLSDLFFVGDVNQIANPAIPIRLVMQLAMSVRS